MRVRQLCCNAGIHFQKGLMNKYGLFTYRNPYKPCLWCGCYGEEQIDKICNHKSFALLMWAGTDISWAVKRSYIVDKLKSVTHITHIAISSFIEEDLKKVGISYVSLPICAYENEIFKPEPLGDSIYIYKSLFKTYGFKLNQKIKKLLPNINFIECDFHTVEYKEMFNIYKKCFLGLRFTGHDGLSNTVCELGLMGRKVLWNGNTPNALSYNKNNINDIIEKINIEYDNRYTDNYLNIGERVKNYLNIGDNFLNI